MVLRDQSRGQLVTESEFELLISGIGLVILGTAGSCVR